MLKQSRLFFSAALVALLVISTFVVPTPTQACPVRIPSTLLSLYLESDMIVLADYTSERITNRENEDEVGFYATIERNLDAVQILKGQKDLRQVSFSDYEYRAKANPSNSEFIVDGFEVSRYSVGQKVSIGKRYLFFLTKDEETNEYVLSDDISAVKDVEGKFDIYEKSINELAGIVANEENQLANLNEWLVKTLEEPETRWDATYDLYQSLSASNSKAENSVEDDASPFKLDENFGSYTPAIIENLTDSQRNKISSILFEKLQQAWFSADSNEIYVDYRLTSIVGSWDKSRLAIYGFSVLQSVDEKDSVKRKQIMDFISNIIDDAGLSEIYYDYMEKAEEVITQNNDAKKPEAKKALNSLIEEKNALSRDFNNRFQIMFSRNFEHAEEGK